MAEFKGHAADGGRGRREGDTERLQLVQEAVEVGGVCGWVTGIWREGRRKEESSYMHTVHESSRLQHTCTSPTRGS